MAKQGGHEENGSNHFWPSTSRLISGEMAPSDGFPLLGHGSAFGKCNLGDGSGHEFIHWTEASSLASLNICFCSGLHRRQSGGCLLGVLALSDCSSLAYGLAGLSLHPGCERNWGSLVYKHRARAKATGWGHDPGQELHWSFKPQGILLWYLNKFVLKGNLTSLL